MNGRALFITGPGQAAVETVPVADPGAGQVRVVTERSGVSAGTEMLLYKGGIPEGTVLDETLPHLAEPLRWPARTGYAAVGRVDAAGPAVDPALVGRRVFAFRPHQDVFLADADRVVALPESLSPDVAVLLANMETAVSLVMDGGPVLGESAAVVGQGVVGLLTGALLSRHALERVVVCDPISRRRDAARELCRQGIARLETQPPGSPRAEFDLVFELSGQVQGLEEGLARLRYGGRLVAGSWYGSRPTGLTLDSRLHRNRNTVLFSQVSRIDGRLQDRFDHVRRLQIALSWLERLPLDALITHRVPLEEAPAAYEHLATSGEDCLQVVITHERGGS